MRDGRRWTLDATETTTHTPLIIMKTVLKLLNWFNRFCCCFSCCICVHFFVIYLYISTALLVQRLRMYCSALDKQQEHMYTNLLEPKKNLTAFCSTSPVYFFSYSMRRSLVYCMVVTREHENEKWLSESAMIRLLSFFVLCLQHKRKAKLSRNTTNRNLNTIGSHLDYYYWLTIWNVELIIFECFCVENQSMNWMLTDWAVIIKFDIQFCTYKLVIKEVKIS